MNKLEEFTEIADPKTRQEIRELLELLDNTTDVLERTAILFRVQTVIETRLGLKGIKPRGA